MDQTVLKKLQNFANPLSGNYTIDLRNLLFSIDIDRREKVFSEILCDESLDDRIRFNAFYALSIYYRRGEHMSDYCRLVDKYIAQFEQEYPLTDINWAIYYKYKSRHDNSQLIRAIEHAERAAERIRNNPGVYQTCADLVVQALDKGIQIPRKDERIKNADKLIDRAIDINVEYPKYYCTKGRLSFHLGEYEKALNLLENAIDLEKLNDNDSVLRTTQYYYYLIDIQSKEMGHRLDKESKEMVYRLDRELHSAAEQIECKVQENKKQTDKLFGDLDSMKSKYLEFLAFFASILAFIISTINIIQRFSVREAISLLLVMGGILNITFALFRLIIEYNNTNKGYIRTTLIVLAGALLIALGYGMTI